MNDSFHIKINKINNFPQFYANAAKFRSTYFLTYFSIHQINTTNEAQIHYAVIASKKGVHKNATNRNRARRRLKSAFQAWVKATNFHLPIEIRVLFMANKSVLEADWKGILAAMNQTMGFILSKINSSLEKKL